MAGARDGTGRDIPPTLHRQSNQKETLSDRAQRTIAATPFWVIAVAAHATLAAILAMTALRHDRNSGRL